ncbi:MAG TPA: Minf_1886 family protein [Candidatus Eisenbacteria bacterium]|nr:Minf_1886 family protein [Candidatus Eisenbacteria bacterium]
MAIDYETALLDLATKHGRYRPNAYRFTLDAVSHTVTRLSELRHVNGKEVLMGIRELAVSRYGPMAKTVFEQWGIRKTEDFGEIVFQLVDEGLLGKTESDRKSDFASGYDFDEAFVRGYDWLDRIVPKRRWVIE